MARPAALLLVLSVVTVHASTYHLAYATYLNNGFNPLLSSGGSIALNAEGSLYIAGLLENPTLPCTVGTSQPDTTSQTVTKLSPAGDKAIWTVCIPGFLYDIALDANQAPVVVAGQDGKSLVYRLDPLTGTPKLLVTLAHSSPRSLAITRSNEIYIAGSATADFKPSPNAYLSQGLTTPCLSTTTACTDGFVAKWNSDGLLRYATFTGSRGTVRDIAVDSTGAIWAVGTYPVTSTTGGRTRSWGSSFALKLDKDGGSRPLFVEIRGGIYSQIPISTYVHTVLIDAQDSTYVAGSTPSSNDFVPTPNAIKPGSFPTGHPSDPKPFVWKFDSSGKTLYATYLWAPSGPYATPILLGDEGQLLAFQSHNSWMQDRCGPSGSSLAVVNKEGSAYLSRTLLPFQVFAAERDAQGNLHSLSIVPSPFTTVNIATPGALHPRPGGALASKLTFGDSVPPALHCVANAASLQIGKPPFPKSPDGSVAPGELISIFGAGFPADGKVKLTFDGLPSPILYASDSQINAVVPLDLDLSRQTTTLRLDIGTLEPLAKVLPLIPASPGIFLYGSPLRAAALNQDGSLNSESNGAEPGSVMTLFLTGAGQYDQIIENGAPGPTMAPFPKPLLNVRVVVQAGGTGTVLDPSEILFFGQAPGLVAGVVQLNVRLPAKLPSGSASVQVHLGQYTGQNSGTIFIK